MKPPANPWGLEPATAQVLDALLRLGTYKLASAELRCSHTTIHNRLIVALRLMGVRTREQALVAWALWNSETRVPGFGVRATVHAVPATDALPDADTDVLIWDFSSTEAQLGALIGDEQGRPQWVDAQGQVVHGVTYWAPMPELKRAA
jgi:hypothetical protein